VKRRAVLAVALLALVLSGCGGGGSSDEQPPPRHVKPSSNQNPDANLGAP
jgi:hypothetical protein